MLTILLYVYRYTVLNDDHDDDVEVFDNGVDDDDGCGDEDDVGDDDDGILQYI